MTAATAAGTDGEHDLDARRRCADRTPNAECRTADASRASVTLRPGPGTRSDSPPLAIATAPLRCQFDRQSSTLPRGGVMRRRSALVITALTITGTVLASTPASARPIDKGHFHDVFTTDPYN